MNPLTAAVRAYQAQAEICSASFSETVAKIDAEMDALGLKQLWSSPTETGICRTFYRSPDGASYGGGVDRVADAAHPEHFAVGDRCFALELADREQSIKLVYARDAVVEIVRPFAAPGVSDDALLAAALAVVACTENGGT